MRGITPRNGRIMRIERKSRAKLALISGQAESLSSHANKPKRCSHSYSQQIGNLKQYTAICKYAFAFRARPAFDRR